MERVRVTATSSAPTVVGPEEPTMSSALAPTEHRIQVWYTLPTKHGPRMTHYECSCGAWNHRHAEWPQGSHWIPGINYDPLEEIIKHFREVEGIPRVQRVLWNP